MSLTIVLPDGEKMEFDVHIERDIYKTAKK